MADTVKVWEGDCLFGVGYPVVIVTTQDRDGNEYPGEFFLWVQEMPSLKFKSMHQGIAAVDTPEAVEAGFEMSQEEVEKEAFSFAQGNLQHWQWEAYEKHRYDPALKPADLHPAEDWKQALYRLRLQGRLEESLTKSIGRTTISKSLHAFLDLLARVSPVRRTPPHPYEGG